MWNLVERCRIYGFTNQRNYGITEIMQENKEI